MTAEIAALDSRARNVNSLWAWVLGETLARLGLRRALISPGSRSGPLTVALAEQPQIEAIPILDERSASFCALGMAQVSLQPVALICTSGTAAANYYAAVIEASLSHLPLLVITADRPPELRDCHAGQAMDQVKLYGHYPRWQTELATPSLELSQLAYLRQTLIQAWSISLFPNPGPVHLNIPFREPLAPIADAETTSFYQSVAWDSFFSQVQPPPSSISMSTAIPWSTWSSWQRGVIIAGPSHSHHPQAEAAAVHKLAHTLGWPILADALSPVRHVLEETAAVIASYDLLLRQPQIAAKLAPACVIQLGELPTSKPLRTWLETTDAPRWIITPHSDNFDPLHGRTQAIRTSVDALTSQIPPEFSSANDSAYLQAWQNLDGQCRAQLQELLAGVDWLCEPKLAWLLAENLPPRTPIFVASSMPVRDVETVWPVSDRGGRFYFNRGANGIDGTLSTALGVAWQQQPTVLITGDLALLHDSNGFLLNGQFQGSLTIVLINNQGGGIFGHLPIHQAPHVFESFFATPQAIDFAQLAQAHRIPHHRITAWSQLPPHLQNLPKSGIQLLEVLTDRERDAQFRQQFLYPLAQALTLP